MRDHDLASSKRLARASDLGEIKSRRLSKKGAQAEREALEKSLAETKAELGVLRDDVARLAETLGLTAATTVSDITAWLNTRERAMDEWATHQDRVKTLEERQLRFANASSILTNALDTLGVKHSGDDETVLAVCERTLATLRANAEAYRVAKAKCDTLARQQKQRTEAAKTAQSACAVWQREWTDALAQVALEHDAPRAIKARLEDLADLSIKFDERQKLNRRISLMEASVTAFFDAVTQLADEIGLGNKDADALETFASLKAEAKALNTRDVQRSALRSQIDRDRAELQSKTAELSALNDEAEALCTLINAEDLAACIETLESAGAAQALTDQTATLRRQLSGLLASEEETAWSTTLSPLMDSQEALAAAEADQKNAELQIDMEENHVRELYAQWKAAEHAQNEIGDDASAAQLQQERATLLEDIKRGALKFVSLKAGALVVDEAVRLFRDQHRGAMLKLASDAFSTMTLGRYPRLVTMTSDDREILVAERNDKTTLSADSLSTGTRAQLYLALRIAGHAEYAKSQTPLPFIADDILEEFDNHRAKETLLLMTKMAEAGQVIYLTHHQHLVDMAQDIAAERCSIHRLNPTSPDPAANAV